MTDSDKHSKKTSLGATRWLLPLAISILIAGHARADQPIIQSGILPSLDSQTGDASAEITPVSELMPVADPHRIEIPADTPAQASPKTDAKPDPKLEKAAQKPANNSHPAAKSVKTSAIKTKKPVVVAPEELSAPQAVSDKKTAADSKPQAASADKAFQAVSSDSKQIIAIKKKSQPEMPITANNNKPMLDTSSSIVPGNETAVTSKTASKPVPVALSQGDGSQAQEIPAVNKLGRFAHRVNTNINAGMHSGLNTLGFSIQKNEKDNIKPVSYSPLPAIVIFPVMKHGNEAAFGDLPQLFAREFAQRMELRAPDTKIYHPVYTVDELRLRGLGHVYDQIMEYYIKAGRPEPRALDYLLKQLTGDGQPVARVIFVEADLDMNRPDEPSGLVDRLNSWSTDAVPKQMKYFIRSRTQVFDAENPEFPMVWGNSWSRSIKTNRFYNVTTSVYTDSDSQQAFAKVSREMSREVLLMTPKEVYMEPQYNTAVQGKLVSDTATGQGAAESAPKKAQAAAFPNFTEVHSAGSGVTDENKQAIQRILQRQNSISP